MSRDSVECEYLQGSVFGKSFGFLEKGNDVDGTRE